MFKKVIGFIGLCAVALSMTACSRIEPVQNPQNQFVPTGLTQTQVKNAIITAASRKGWTASETSPGMIDAHISVHDKRYAAVKIPYSNKSYSILYASSANLMANSRGDIHRKYNDWVIRLNEQIQKQLRLQNVKVSTAEPAKTPAKPKTTTQSSAVAKTKAKTTTTTTTTTVQPVAAVPSAAKQ